MGTAQNMCKDHVSQPLASLNDLIGEAFGQKVGLGEHLDVGFIVVMV